MRHHNANRKFGLPADKRKALFRSMALSLIVREKIKTTGPKAKELRPFIEKLVTRSRENTLAVKRFLITQVGKEGAKKLIEKIGPKYKDRNGGYVRIIKMPRRLSDGSAMSYIEFV